MSLLDGEMCANEVADIHPLLRRRQSPRIFADMPVGPDKLTALFEAARCAPSAYNERPWSFAVAPRDDPARFGPMLDIATRSNRAWAWSAAVARARRLLGLPAGHDPVTMFAVGYLGDVNRLGGELRVKEGATRQRKPLAEVLAWGGH
jgi:hypothetical protein